MNSVKYALSDLDIRKIAPNCKVMKYDDLYKYTGIDDLLRNTNAVALLYRQASNFGHWCTITRDRYGNVSFFDSYGLMPDDELRWTFSVNDELGQDVNILSKMLYEHSLKGNSVEYNEFPFQKDKDGINSCGRYSSLRCRMHKLTLPEFQRFLLKYKNPDIAVVKLTNKFLFSY